MVRIRVKYEASADETEMQLLRGEYKFYTGKPVHLRDASVSDLVAMVSCSAFFGFWDTALVDRILELLLGRMEELSAMELAQLAQDLPLIERSRSPQMRAVFKLLCANNCEKLREDLSFEDHLDLIDRAVGQHCPLIFVTTLLELIDPFLPGYAAFLEENGNQNDNDQITSEDNKTRKNNNNNINSDNENKIQFKSEGLLNILETVLLAQNLFEKRMNVLSSRTGGAAMVEKETAKFEPLKLSLIRRLKQQLLSNAKDQMEGNFTSDVAESYKKKNIHDSSENQTGASASTHHPKYLLKKETDADLFPLMPPVVMAKTFHALASLQQLDIFTAHKVLEYFWTSSMLNRLSCGDCLGLCLTYVETFGITTFFEEEFLIAVAQFHLIESISFLDAAELSNAFELIALFALEASSSPASLSSASLGSDSNKNNNNNNNNSVNIRTRRNILNRHLLITSDFFDAALDHLILLKDVGGLASVWPTEFILRQLKSLSVIITCLRREESLKKKHIDAATAAAAGTTTTTTTLSSGEQEELVSACVVVKEFSDHQFASSMTIQYHRPKLQAAVKSLCGSLIFTVNSNMTPQDCCVFLGVVATMDDYVLDSAVAAVIKRLVRNWNNSNMKSNDNDENGDVGEREDNNNNNNRDAVNLGQQQQQKKKLADMCYLHELKATEINDLLTLWTNIIDENNNIVDSTKRSIVGQQDNSSKLVADLDFNEGRRIRVHPLVQTLLIPALRSAQKRSMEMQLQ